MSDTIKTLSEFLTTAEKNRKYPRNTVYGIRAALRLFAQELTDEEKESLDTFKNRFEQIYQNVFNKNKANIAASSLETYRRRMRGLINDYEKYGIDPTKMASWTRPLRIKRKKDMSKRGRASKQKKDVVETQKTQTAEKGPSMDRFELSLRPDAKAIILVPSDIKANEIKKIKGLVDYLTANIQK